MASIVTQADQQLDFKKVRVIANSELMKNHATGMPVSVEQRMAVCQDDAGFPLLFTIGSDNIFYLIKHVPGSATGWERIDLSSAIDSNKEAVTFAVSQDGDGALHIALALRSKTDEADTTLYVAPDLSNSTSDADWSQLASRFVVRPYTAGKIKITELLLGVNDDEQGKPLALAAVETPDGEITRAEHYFINTDADDSSWSWERFPIPENATHILDMAIGTVEGDRGVYALYQTLSGPSLSFTGPTDPDYPDKRPNYAFSLPQGADVACIAALPGQAINSVLYVAGAGIYSFTGSNRDAVVIWDSEAIASVHELFAEQDSKNVSLWLVAGDDTLYHVRGLRDDNTKWTYPLPMRQNVAQIAALRDQTRLTSQLFVVHGDNTLAYLYQDPGTTLWRETNVPLADTGHLLEFNCYTTHLHFEDKEFQPLTNKPVKITASAWAYITVNGTVHSVDSTTPVTVNTDLQGNITIINKVEKLATPIFHIQAQFLDDQVIDVNPGHKISEGLKQVKSGDDLKGATLHDGQPLLDKSFDSNVLNGAAQSVQQLAQAGDNMPADGSAAGGAHMRAMAVGPSLHRVDPSRLPPGHIWGMSFADGQPTYVEGEAARALSSDAPAHGMTAMMSAKEFFADIGDFFESLWNGLKEIGHFVLEAVEDGLKFLINVAGKVFNFVLKTVMEVLKVVNWVLEHTLGISIEKFIKWLGFIFNWDDIKKMHTVIKHVTNQAMDFAQAEAESLEEKVAAFFEDLKDRWQRLEPLPEGEGDQDAKTGSHQFISQKGQNTGVSSAIHSPGGNWSNYQTLHGGVLAATWDVTQTPSDPLTAFIEDVLAPTVASFADTIKKLFEDLRDAFEQSKLSFNQVLEKLETDFIIGLLDAMEKLVVGLIKFVADIVRITQDLINRPVNIPFIGAFVQWLYKEISGSELTILDGFALLVAIPSTLAYKILTNKSPFDSEIDLTKASYQEIFGLLQGESAGPASHMQAMAVSSTSITDSAQPDGDKLPPAVLGYSHWGGIVADIAAFIGDVLSLVESVSQEDSAEEATGVLDRLKGMGTAERIAVALALIQSALSFPVGHDPEVPLQRAVWGITTGGTLVRPMLPGPVKGGWAAAQGLTNFALEIAIFAEEMGHAKDEEKAGDILKFFENLTGFLAEEAEAATYLDQEEISKTALGVASGGLYFISGMLDITRVIAIDVPNELAHMSH